MRAVQRFRMTDVEPAARPELPGETLDQRLLGRRIEIDHHVAAEDDIEQTLERPRPQQVELAERNHRSQLFRYLHGLLALAAGKELFIFGGNVLGGADGELAAGGLGENIGIDIGRQHAQVMPGEIADVARDHAPRSCKAPRPTNNRPTRSAPAGSGRCAQAASPHLHENDRSDGLRGIAWCGWLRSN